MRKARVDDIITLAARIWKVDRSDILGPARNRIVIRPRHAVCLVGREFGHSFNQIAAKLNRDDHTTIRNGYLKAMDLAKRDADYGEQIDRLRRLARTSEPYVLERLEAVRRAAARIPDRVVIEEPEDAPEPLILPRNLFDNSDEMFCRQARAENSMKRASEAFAELLQGAA